MNTIIAIFCIVMALGITLLWVKEIISPHLKESILKRREGDHLVWPHVATEAFTAALLFVSGVGALLHIGWAPIVNFFSLGALAYASFNGLSWTLANNNRWIYTIYMLVGLIGSNVLIILSIRQIIS